VERSPTVNQPVGVLALLASLEPFHGTAGKGGDERYKQPELDEKDVEGDALYQSPTA